jgi:hypothetical protein
LSQINDRSVARGDSSREAIRSATPDARDPPFERARATV